ncbi:MAG: SRPBCC family protein [Myxococcota bacterium]
MTARRPGGRLLAALLLTAFTVPALAWTHTFQDPGITGTLSGGDDDVLATECRLTLDRPPEAVVAVLTDYDRIGEWMPDTVEYKVLKREGLNGRFYRHSKTPFFMKKLWAIVDATVTTGEDKKTHVTWHRTEGTITLFDATFDVEPAPQGATVTYKVRTAVPLSMPGFLLKRVGSEAILDTLRGLRAAVYARK